MRSLIIAIVGKSGSGKTELSKKIETFFGISSLVSCTTRPKRPNEIDGVDHKFVTDADMPGRETMLAYTLYGGYHYWVTHDQLMPNVVYTYVINEDALVEMIDKFSFKYNFVTVYVDRTNIDVSEDRTLRDKDRTELDKIFYDYVIVNDGSFNDFTFKIGLCINTILNEITNH